MRVLKRSSPVMRWPSPVARPHVLRSEERCPNAAEAWSETGMQEALREREIWGQGEWHGMALEPR